MPDTVPKGKFKAHALDYFRQVERTGRELVITDRGRPVLRLLPYRFDPEDCLRELRGTVVRYDQPTEPVDADSWEALQ
jgi:prevent-host-death family protein